MPIGSHPPNPTPAELEILRVLWSAPGATVREIHDAMSGKPTGYTTVLKTLQIMFEKRLVTREPVGRAHRYYAATPEATVKCSLVADLVDRAFGGAAQGLVMHALASRRPSAAELQEIRTLLDRLEKEAE